MISTDTAGIEKQLFFQHSLLDAGLQFHCRQSVGYDGTN